jgi:2-polyprenyl-3-methyl-5-hydroxy-6-metoxy-1,4-benzoquinol methylase
MPKQTVSDFFDSYSHDFNAIYGNENTFLNRVINGLFRKSMRLRYLKSLEGCEPIAGKTVLDVGCGPGHYGIALAVRGAPSVLGIDFAGGMIELAKQNAARAGVRDRCEFVTADFMTYSIPGPFDYSIVMGFMDYASEPWRVVERVLSLTRAKAFFSFPVDGGVLGWQRKLRYKRRCDLVMYRREQIDDLFQDTHLGRFEVEKISRDFFVTAFSECPD